MSRGVHGDAQSAGTSTQLQRRTVLRQAPVEVRSHHAARIQHASGHHHPYFCPQSVPVAARRAAGARRRVWSRKDIARFAADTRGRVQRETPRGEGAVAHLAGRRAVGCRCSQWSFREPPCKPRTVVAPPLDITTIEIRLTTLFGRGSGWVSRPLQAGGGSYSRPGCIGDGGGCGDRPGGDRLGGECLRCCTTASWWTAGQVTASLWSVVEQLVATGWWLPRRFSK